MLRIRLRRVGAKRRPSYRIVIIDSEAQRSGRYIESVGFYNPRTRPATELVKEDRALYWLSVGAQPSEPVERIFKHTGTADRFVRFRAGEALETLVAEAQPGIEAAAAISPKTRFPAPAQSSKAGADQDEG